MDIRYYFRRTYILLSLFESKNLLWVSPVLIEDSIYSHKCNKYCKLNLRK